MTQFSGNAEKRKICMQIKKENEIPITISLMLELSFIENSLSVRAKKSERKERIAHCAIFLPSMREKSKKGTSIQQSEGKENFFQFYFL